MQIRKGKPPGSGRLARIGVELSREARVQIRLVIRSNLNSDTFAGAKNNLQGILYFQAPRWTFLSPRSPRSALSSNKNRHFLVAVP
jgi:hypothetical protein